MAIYGNVVGGNSGAIGKTFILEDPSGLEITGVVTENERVFNATPNDVRTGCVCVTGDGIITGTKDIPAYRTSVGNDLIFPNEDFIITSLSQFEQYDYTQIQCIINIFNTDIAHSLVTEKVVISDGVYNVSGDIKISSITKDNENKTIKLNINNNTKNTYLIRYFTYKEEI